MNTRYSNSAYNMICSNLEGPHDIEIWCNNIGMLCPGTLNYIERGLTESQALAEEAVAYTNSSYRNADALFCAFQIVHREYMKARRVNPDDNQQEGL